MRLLLDTHVVLWQLSGTRALSPSARKAIAEADDVLLSAVSYAEMGIKASVGKLTVPDDLQSRIENIGVRTLALSPAHGLAVARLPVHHRDPFDRLIIAQATVEALTCVTADARFSAYGITVLQA
ncbi:MAG: type II toxin-antitoxin system VapC family toxin [Austwickia sp.]|nr:type II toxin-antitoxin system VapC family toxin [Actinomycetota bacterium]MCB1253774.1 type II toxin-antitoxin system VapC family toxin [Austwickia sp.]MCO5308192.1 type II toxin-antitoxin system VapC family toxin [Austwickia sp.]